LTVHCELCGPGVYARCEPLLAGGEVTGSMLITHPAPLSESVCARFWAWSVGIAGCPDHGSNVEAVLRNADTGLYEAKKDGRNCVASRRSSPRSHRR
jgi:hypothetical protein